MPTVEKALFTVSEAATYLAVGRRKVWQLLAAGKLKRARISRKATRVTRRSLEQYVQELTRTG